MNKEIEEFIKRVMVSDDVISNMEIRREKEWDTMMTFTITIEGHSYKDEEGVVRPPVDCAKAIEEYDDGIAEAIMRTERETKERIKQIVIEDVPHLYQDRLLKELK